MDILNNKDHSDHIDNIERPTLSAEQIQRKQEEDERRLQQAERFKDIPLTGTTKLNPTPKGHFPQRRDGTLVGNQKGSKVVGRQQKRTKEVLKSIQYVMGLCEVHMEEDIKALTSLQRVRLWADLQEYVRPKLARIEQTGEDGGPLKHRHTILLRPQADDIAVANRATPMEIEEEQQQELIPEFTHAECGEFVTDTLTTKDEKGNIAHNIAQVRKIPSSLEFDNAYAQCPDTIPETEVEVIK